MYAGMRKKHSAWSANVIRLCLFIFFLSFIFLFQATWIQATESTDVSLDFIYVNANTGEAAGGHAAVRMESTIFHYQFFPDGRFVLVRDSWSHFRYVYNELNNRSIFIARLPLTSAVYSRVRNHFTGLLIAQQQNLDQLRNAEDHLSLIEQLVHGSGQVELPAVGLFDKNRGDNPAMADLRQVVLRKQDKAGYATRPDQIRQILATCLTRPGVIDWSSRTAKIRQLLLEREFFELVQQKAFLSNEAVVSLAQAPVLSPDEKKFLRNTEKNWLYLLPTFSGPVVREAWRHCYCRLRGTSW